MDIDSLALPDDIAALKAIILGDRARQSDTDAYIAHLTLQIEKLKRALYGPKAERTARLLDQMELKLEELEAAATEDELRAEQEAAKAKTTTVAGFTRKPLRWLSTRCARGTLANSAHRASPSPSTYPASGSSCPGQPSASAAVARAWPSSGRVSPRRWNPRREGSR